MKENQIWKRKYCHQNCQRRDLKLLVSNHYYFYVTTYVLSLQNIFIFIKRPRKLLLVKNFEACYVQGRIQHERLSKSWLGPFQSMFFVYVCGHFYAYKHGSYKYIQLHLSVKEVFQGQLFFHRVNSHADWN